MALKDRYCWRERVQKSSRFRCASLSMLFKCCSTSEMTTLAASAWALIVFAASCGCKPNFSSVAPICFIRSPTLAPRGRLRLALQAIACWSNSATTAVRMFRASSSTSSPSTTDPFPPCKGRIFPPKFAIFSRILKVIEPKTKPRCRRLPIEPRSRAEVALAIKAGLARASSSRWKNQE